MMPGAGDSRDRFANSGGVSTSGPAAPGVPGGGYAGVNGRAPSPPESTVVYTDDDVSEFNEDDRC